MNKKQEKTLFGNVLPDACVDWKDLTDVVGLYG
jgi:3-deoxy-D-arabino-heptulosonate 7-phosphate (DAHP) synthase